MNFDQICGRRHAVDVIKSAVREIHTTVHLREVLGNLRRSSEQMPEPFAQGVMDVVSDIEKRYQL